MARIYVASSWRNELQPQFVEALRKRGHKVYDFRHPNGRDDRSVWEELGISENGVTGDAYDRGISEKVAKDRFEEHFTAMKDADTCVLLLPCGRSAHVEAGIMKGLGKRVFVYSTGLSVKPELMYRVFDGFFHDPYTEDLFKAVAEPQPGICRVCGCTEDNPCYNEDSGYCWWADEECTICSHCADMAAEGEYSIAKDPKTVHCVNDHGTAFQ